MQTNKTEDTIVGWCASIGFGAGLLVDGFSGFLSGTTCGGTGLMIGGGVGKGIYWTIRPLINLSYNADNTSHEVNETAIEIKKIARMLRINAENGHGIFGIVGRPINHFIDIGTGAVTLLIGFLTSKSVEYLNLNQEKENDVRMQNLLNNTSMVLIILGVGTIVLGVFRGIIRR